MGISMSPFDSWSPSRLRVSRLLGIGVCTLLIVPALILLFRRLFGAYADSPHWCTFSLIQNCGFVLAVAACRVLQPLRETLAGRRATGWGLTAGLVLWGAISLPWPLPAGWYRLLTVTLLFAWWGGCGLFLGETAWPDRMLRFLVEFLEKCERYCTVPAPTKTTPEPAAPLAVYPQAARWEEPATIKLADHADHTPTTPSLMTPIEEPDTLPLTEPEFEEAGLLNCEATVSSQTRWNDEAGADVLSGEWNAHCPAGQTQTNLHIPFLPPFAGLPEVLAEITGENVFEATLRVGLVTPFGARLELIRRGTDKPEQTLLIEFEARCEPSLPRD